MTLKSFLIMLHLFVKHQHFDYPMVFLLQKMWTCHLVGGLEHEFYDFPFSCEVHHPNCHRIGWWEHLQENPSNLMVKTHGFRLRFSQQNQSIDRHRGFRDSDCSSKFQPKALRKVDLANLGWATMADLGSYSIYKYWANPMECIIS